MFLAFSSGSSPIKSTNSAWTCFMLSDPCISVELWLYKSNENKRPLPPPTLFSYFFIAITSKVVDHAARPRRNVKSNCVPVVNRLLRGWWWWWWWWCEYNREACLLNPQNAENGDAIDDDDSDDHEKEPQVSLLVILSRITRRLWNICLLLQVESGECWWWFFFRKFDIILKHTLSHGTPPLPTLRCLPSREVSWSSLYQPPELIS